MNDLTERANKYARGAGRTQEGHYIRAKRDERVSNWIGWSSAGLSAAVGTSIFAQWVHSDPIPFGLAAILAATLTAVQRTSKLAERAEAHRVAGTEYGRLRRRADMLQLRLKGGDISREAAMSELDTFGERLSDLAKKSRVLPDATYKRAKRLFDKDHEEYKQVPKVV
jgi:hypothetical protein